MRGEEIPVELCSSLEGTGVDEVWDAVQTVRADRDLELLRRDQALRWMWRIVELDLQRALHHHRKFGRSSRDSRRKFEMVRCRKRGRAGAAQNVLG